MAFRLPNGSTFDFAATYSADVTVTSISNAAAAVVTATGHSFVAGDIVVLQSGWVKATSRAFRVAAPIVAGTSFVLEGLNTTSTVKFPTGSSAGTVKKVATWVNIPQITGITATGGEQQFYTFGFLEEEDDRQVPTTKSPSLLTLTVADDPTAAYVPVVEAADDLSDERVQRLNLVSGAKIFYNSIASITMTPTMTRNQLMERTITLAQQGQITRYAS